MAPKFKLTIFRIKVEFCSSVYEDRMIFKTPWLLTVLLLLLFISAQETYGLGGFRGHYAKNLEFYRPYDKFGHYGTLFWRPTENLSENVSTIFL